MQLAQEGERREGQEAAGGRADGLETGRMAPCRGREDSRVWARPLGQAGVIS